MNILVKELSGLPTDQQAIHKKCFHPSGKFLEFRKEEVDQSIPHRFEEQVRKYPERLAVKTKDRALTYEQLNREVNRVANALLSERGGREEPIALLFEQGSAVVIVALLGVLKAGKFYVCLDVSHPLARNRRIVKESLANLILTDDQNYTLAEELGEKKVLSVNIDDIPSNTSEQNPGLSLPIGALANILYTSGSTGDPKGVVHTHQTLLHMVRNHTNMFHICNEDRVNLLYSPGVIGGPRDILGALLNGAALFPFSLKHEGIAILAEWLASENLTTYRSAATVFRHFVGILKPEETFPRLRLIYLGNETLYRTDIERYQQGFSPDCVFASGLGTTEMSGFRIYFADKATRLTERTIPSGYPVEGASVMLLDESGQSVELGQPGEIAIKSLYLPHGYWRNSELTRSKFLPAPDGGEERVYLTGDLGRLLPDGCLLYLGRKDFQVKVRGYSVSIDAIEAALRSFEKVKEAVVVARANQSGDQQLVAYVVSAQIPRPTVSALRRSLSEIFPDYMVPTAFVMLDSLPQATNGKVDRSALPVPDGARPELEDIFVPPRTPVEKTLVQIWSDVLELDKIGVHDNFLELGGNSLLAGQVITRVLRSFTVELSPKTLFEASTVAAMALELVQHQAEIVDQSEVQRILDELEEDVEKDTSTAGLWG